MPYGTPVYITAAIPLETAAPVGGATEVTLALILAKVNNLDVALSTRTKPTDTQQVAGTVAVSNLPQTQPVSGTVNVGNLPATQPVSGIVTADAAGLTAADLGVTNTGLAAAAVTGTLPAVAAKFHYITRIEITLYNTAARTGSATPVLVTSTNLPGNPVWNFPSAGAVGTVERLIIEPSKPLKSSVANTATTIVCPATTGVIWRINVSYEARA